MLRWLSGLVLVLLASPGISRSVSQATAEGVLPVSARIASTCDIGGSVSGILPRGLIDFGTRTAAGGTTLRISGTLPIRCIGAGTPEVTLDYGQNATGTQRNLLGPGGTLIAYDLLRGQGSDAPLWDNGSHPVALADDAPQSIDIAGRITFPANAVDGVYADLVLVRIDY